MFVFVAMALFLAHAFVPHCYHACHGFVAAAHEQHDCSHHDCPTHHTNETHFCHAHHLHGNEDDCLLNKPFLKSTDNYVKSAPTPLSNGQDGHTLGLDFAIPTLQDLTTHHFAIAANGFPDLVPLRCIAGCYTTAGLRAPPLC